VLRLTMDRPAKRNALSASLCEDLVSALVSANEDQRIGAILLEGDGAVFCAGMDLEEALAPNAPALTGIHEKLFSAGTWLDKPLVAAVNGPAYGGGVGLVATAHIAVAVETGEFTLAEIRIGMWPFVIWRVIVAAFGERRAMELSLTGRSFSSHEAFQWGLVHVIGSQQKALEIARHLAESSPEAILRGLQLARGSRGLSSEAAGQLALELRTAALRSRDFEEGVAALREKRRPNWPSIER
jgi:enoyl-CoA hydratase/carnithine racemase